MRADKTKFRIINGIPENHSYARFINNNVTVRVSNGKKIHQIRFDNELSSLDLSIAYYIGVLSGQLLTDNIQTLNLEVEIEIWEIA